MTLHLAIISHVSCSKYDFGNKSVANPGACIYCKILTKSNVNKKHGKYIQYAKCVHAPEEHNQLAFNACSLVVWKHIF